MRPQWRAYAALGAVCVLWGTTYLGIRIALESFPPATLISLRYLLSGAIMLAVAKAARAKLPEKRELFLTSLYGLIILGIGNGALAFAEQWVPSGLAALFITTSPFWMVGTEALFPGGERLHGPTIAGMLVGLLGTVLLVLRSSADMGGSSAAVWQGFGVLQLSAGGWAVGSILQRRQPTKAHPVVSAAVQQFTTGLVFILPALLLKHQPIHWNARGCGAVIYLAVFGGAVGYSAYIYALDHLPVPVVSLYTYVNPVVAVLLGYLFYREPFGWREAGAMAIIFVGVAIVKSFGAKQRTRVVQSPLQPAD